MLPNLAPTSGLDQTDHVSDLHRTRRILRGRRGHEADNGGDPATCKGGGQSYPTKRLTGLILTQILPLADPKVLSLFE